MNSFRFGRRLLAAGALVLLLPAPLVLADSSIERIDPNRFGIDQAEIGEIKAQMRAAVDGGFLNGALLLVGNGEGVGLLESVGLLSPENPVPIDQESIFRIYSMTKPIVSVAIMTLVEDGLLALDDSVSKFIPEFADGQVIDRETGESRPVENAMTVENLLTHQSGLIQAFFSPNSELGKMYGAELRGDLDNREFAARIGRLPLYFEPGTAWHYGHSTDVLGALLEVVDGKTLDLVLNERIFAPLGMDDTGFVVPQSDADRVAEPIHGAMPDATVARAMLSGGGGLKSTTEDYARFAQMLLNGGEYQGARIIEEATLAQMLEPKVGDSVSRKFFFYGDTGDWGLGFHLQPTTDDPSGPHNFGWRGIGGTIFIVDQENDFYMIYMEQKRGGPQAPFNANIAQRVVYGAMRD